MKLVFFASIALALSCLQHSTMSGWWVAPDLPLAFAAWSMVDGDDDGVLLRAWLVGILRDLVDPGSGLGYGTASLVNQCFHTLTYSMLGVAALALRTFVFRSRSIGWGAWAFAASAVLALIDCRLGGMAIPWIALLLDASMTALAAMALGWLLGGLPEPLRPIGHGGA